MIYTPADAWPRAYQDGFSVTEWTAQPSMQKSVIIVQADKRFKDIGAPLANALIALMTSNILSPTNTPIRGALVVLDETKNLPRNDSLYEWMCLGRLKGCRIVAGTQSISQLKQIYSENADSRLSCSLCSSPCVSALRARLPAIPLRRLVNVKSNGQPVVPGRKIILF